MNNEHACSKTCPSAKCEVGSQLIGIVKEDGKVDMLQHPMVINQGFVDTATQGREPNMRFRFAGKCVEHACGQWTGDRCGVIDKVLTHLKTAAEQFETTRPLPTCAIRPNCRWFNQTGPQACQACPLIITGMPALQLLT